MDIVAHRWNGLAPVAGMAACRTVAAHKPAGKHICFQIPASRPIRFHEAAIFQWIKPKAWTMALASSSAYAEVASDPITRAVIIAVTFLVLAPLCNGTWVANGQTLQRLMNSGQGSQFFSAIMVCLVALSAVLINWG